MKLGLIKNVGGHLTPKPLKKSVNKNPFTRVLNQVVAPAQKEVKIAPSVQLGLNPSPPLVSFTAAPLISNVVPVGVSLVPPAVTPSPVQNIGVIVPAELSSSSGIVAGDTPKETGWKGKVKDYLQDFMPEVETNVAFDYKKIALVVCGLTIFIAVVAKITSKK